ncbi:MAG: hypothetical protein ACI4XR_02780 [Bacilli bacterium]
MKNKIFYLLIILTLGIFIYIINSSYALFETNKSMVVKPNVAKWNININNSNINSSEDFTIDSFVSVTNSHVKEGKIAPGAEGYFDIEIDGQDTDVSISYNLKFDLSSLNNIVIESVEETNGYVITSEEDNTYSGVILLNEINQSVKHNIRFYIKWVNNEDNNDNDSLIGLDKDIEILIPVTIEVKQYIQ